MRRIGIAFVMGGLFCTLAFGQKEKPRDCRDWVASAAAGVMRLSERERFVISSPAFLRLFRNDELEVLLSDREWVFFQSNLKSLIKKIKNVPTESAILTAVAQELAGEVPEKTISGRLEALKKNRKDSVFRALGRNTVEENREIYFGKNPLKPDSKSLLGLYIQETGATTSIRTFPVKHGSRRQGPKRLYVSVGPESWERYLKRLAYKELMTVVGHAFVIQEDTMVSYNHNFEPIRLPRENTPMPLVILSTTEALRLDNFLKLVTEVRPLGSWHNEAMQPWLLPGYCARSYYDNCTQWIGNMPIGDKRVATYRFPGNNEGSSAAKPISQRLREYDHANELMKTVWKVPGNERFADIIGQGAANLRGEFANPGWVIQTLLGPTTNERVPVVFVSRANHQDPFPDDLQLHYENPM